MSTPRQDRTTMDRLLLRPEEAAAMLGIGRSRLYELMRSGAVASLRIGRSRRISPDALDAFVSQLKSGAEPKLSDPDLGAVRQGTDDTAGDRVSEGAP